MTDKTGTTGMHIWPINQIPWPHKLPTLRHTYTHTHTHMLTHSLTLGNREYSSCCQSGRLREGEQRGMGRTWVCHVNNSQVVRASGHFVINVPPHSWHLTQGYIPGVMGSSWTKVSGRTAENKQTGVSVGNTHHYHPPETQTCPLLPSLLVPPNQEIISKCLFIEEDKTENWLFGVTLLTSDAQYKGAVVMPLGETLSLPSCSCIHHLQTVLFALVDQSWPNHYIITKSLLK